MIKFFSRSDQYYWYGWSRFASWYSTALEVYILLMYLFNSFFLFNIQSLLLSTNISHKSFVLGVSDNVIQTSKHWWRTLRWQFPQWSNFQKCIQIDIGVVVEYFILTWTSFCSMHSIRRKWMNFILQIEILLMDWGLRSPELNPIEYFWDLLDENYRIQPDSAYTIQQLTNVLNEKWDNYHKKNTIKIIIFKILIIWCIA